MEYAAWVDMHEERLPAVAASPSVDAEERSAEDDWNRQRMADATGRVPLLLSLFLAPAAGSCLSALDVYLTLSCKYAHCNMSEHLQPA